MTVPGRATTTADVVIVGAGSAGCLLAEQLTRSADRDVLLIERGPGTVFDSELTCLPIAASERAVPVDELGGRPVVRGAGLGGSSAVNGGYFLRGHRSDYEQWPWPHADIDAAFAEVERSMRVRVFADDEIGDIATAFEASRGRPGDAGWTGNGVNRVAGNRTPDGRGRWTSGHALQAAGRRPGLQTMPHSRVRQLVRRGDRIEGVLVERGGRVDRVDAGEVILCAGTLGTAALLVPHLGPLPVHEHAERIVRFTARRPLRAPALLQTVEHTEDGLEIRAYGDDFAVFAPSLPRTGVPVGVADMHGTLGALNPDGAGITVDLGVPDADSASRMQRGVDLVEEMLAGAAFEQFVEPGTVRVDPVVGMSQHAWGSLPAGEATDAGGRVHGMRGLRVVDGSILPGPIRSGPHASVAMLAVLIGSRI